MKTIAKVRLGACTLNVIEPDFSTASRVLHVAERTTVASTALCTDEQVYSTTAGYELGCVKEAIYPFCTIRLLVSSCCWRRCNTLTPLHVKVIIIMFCCSSCCSSCFSRSCCSCFCFSSTSFSSFYPFLLLLLLLFCLV